MIDFAQWRRNVYLSTFRCGGEGVGVAGGVVPVGEVSQGDMLPPVVGHLKKTVVSWLFSEAKMFG